MMFSSIKTLLPVASAAVAVFAAFKLSRTSDTQYWTEGVPCWSVAVIGGEFAMVIECGLRAPFEGNVVAEAMFARSCARASEIQI